MCVCGGGAIKRSCAIIWMALNPNKDFEFYQVANDELFKVMEEGKQRIRFMLSK